MTRLGLGGPQQCEVKPPNTIPLPPPLAKESDDRYRYETYPFLLRPTLEHLRSVSMWGMKRIVRAVK